MKVVVLIIALNQYTMRVLPEPFAPIKTTEVFPSTKVGFPSKSGNLSLIDVIANTSKSVHEHDLRIFFERQKFSHLILNLCHLSGIINQIVVDELNIFARH